jgi:transcription initiation factor IIE alpha subunit
MAVLERQIVDKETGEIKSRGTLGENSNFVMLFRNEISSIVQIQKEDPKAGALFMFFLEHMDQENALIVSQECISELLGWSIPTIKRKIQVLKEKNFISTKRTGNSSIYFVNANVAWSTYGNKKNYAQFKANVLISKSEQEYRVKSSKFKQLDLLN